MEKKLKSYIVLTLGISWVITFLFAYLGKLEGGAAIVMLVPGIMALILKLKTEGFSKNIYKNPNAKGVISFIRAALFAIIYPMIIICICAIVAALIFGDPVNKGFLSTLLDFNILSKYVVSAFFSLNIIFALGEEYGWRAFLLPELNKQYSKVKSSTIVGVVWALYHFPVMILLNISSFGIVKAVGLALVQGFAAFVFSYAFSYCYFLSNRVYPSVIMHGFWNMYNPYVLGSVYFGTKGILNLSGPVFLVNGEGVFGIIFGGIASIIFIKLMNKKDEKVF